MDKPALPCHSESDALRQAFQKLWHTNLSFQFLDGDNMRDNNVVWHAGSMSRTQCERRNGHKGAIIWFTGMSGSGKSTLSCAVDEQLSASGYRTCILDGDNLRHGLCADLGFSDDDRRENIRRAGEVAKLLVDAGMIVLAAFISPFERDRQNVSALVPPGDFLAVYCKCPIEICERRDVKGLFRRARKGQIPHFTGIASSYEEPVDPALTVQTNRQSIQESVASVLSMLHISGTLDMLPQAPCQASRPCVEALP